MEQNYTVSVEDGVVDFKPSMMGAVIIACASAELAFGNASTPIQKWSVKVSTLSRRDEPDAFYFEITALCQHMLDAQYQEYFYDVEIDKADDFDMISNDLTEQIVDYFFDDLKEYSRNSQLLWNIFKERYQNGLVE